MPSGQLWKVLCQSEKQGYPGAESTCRRTQGAWEGGICTASRAVPAAPLPRCPGISLPPVPSVCLAVPSPSRPRSSLLRSGSGGRPHPPSACLLRLPWAAQSSSATKGVAYTPSKPHLTPFLRGTGGEGDPGGKRPRPGGMFGRTVTSPSWHPWC